MKQLANPIKILCALALMAVAVGCASTQSTENLLVAAGFKTVIASTPAQQAHLASLPVGKISTANRGGKTYFVYPDKANNLIYVGGQNQYQAYQDLRLQKQMSNENLMAAEMNEDAAAWDAWGGWGGWGW